MIAFMLSGILLKHVENKTVCFFTSFNVLNYCQTIFGYDLAALHASK